jgi:tetratricopeptide (TPR) repeat protein
VLLRVLGHPAEGLELERQAVAITEPIVGATSTYLADALAGAGLCELALGRHEAARTALERALPLSTASTPAEHGELLLGLARSLPESDARRCSLAREGVRALGAGGALEAEWRDAAPLLAACP